jgi:hypothetical protein
VPLHPYSRSHTRREKRKAKQQLAGGKLDNIASALSDMIDDIDVPPKANPWATIRLHASNTLSTNDVPGKKAPARRAGGMDIE